MIARIWHGKTHASKFQAYTDFTNRMAIPDYTKTEGFIKLSFLRQLKGEEAHFVLITYWKDLEAIRKFAGTDVTKAKYYPEDSTFLLELEPTVQHFEVFSDVENNETSLFNETGN